MYFHDGFGPEFEIAPDKKLANVPRLVIDQAEKTRLAEAEFTVKAAQNVVGILGLDKK
jgi:threonine synthase